MMDKFIDFAFFLAVLVTPAAMGFVYGLLKAKFFPDPVEVVPVVELKTKKSPARKYRESAEDIAANTAIIGAAFTDNARIDARINAVATDSTELDDEEHRPVEPARPVVARQDTEWHDRSAELVDAMVAGQ